MALASRISSASLIVCLSVAFIVAVFIAIAAAIILSLIPTYLATHNLTPAGEKYCIYNLQLNVTFNGTLVAGTYTNQSLINASYALSQACTRILQNYKSDSLLSSCLLSNCSTTNVTVPVAFTSLNIGCYAAIYYSSRCPDEAPNSGLNNSLNSTGNSGCRKQRMTNIDGALGSSVVQYTNVPGLALFNTLVAVSSIYSEIFSNYSQVGAQYCGAINQTAIATAVNTQATG